MTQIEPQAIYTPADEEELKAAMDDPRAAIPKSVLARVLAGKDAEVANIKDAIRRVRIRLSLLSGKYETAGDVAKFHAVEECCGELRKVAEMIEYDRERHNAGGNQS